MQRQVDSVKNPISKALLFASFCFIFQNIWTADSSVSRALDLAKNIVNPGGSVTQQNQQPSKTVTQPAVIQIPGFNVQSGNDTGTQSLHIELIIGSTTYILADNISQSHPALVQQYKQPPSTGVVIPDLQTALNALPLSQWQAGVYFTIVQYPNNVVLYAKDANGNELGKGLIPNLTTIPAGNVGWCGSYVPAANAVNVAASTTVLYQSPAPFFIPTEIGAILASYPLTNAPAQELTSPYTMFYEYNGTTENENISFEKDQYVVFASSNSMLVKQKYTNVIGVPSGTTLAYIKFGGEGSTNASASYDWGGLAEINSLLSGLTGESYLALKYDTTNQNVELYQAEYIPVFNYYQPNKVMKMNSISIPSIQDSPLHSFEYQIQVPGQAPSASVTIEIKSGQFLIFAQSTFAIAKTNSDNVVTIEKGSGIVKLGIVGLTEQSGWVDAMTNFRNLMAACEGNQFVALKYDKTTQSLNFYIGGEYEGGTDIKE